MTQSLLILTVKKAAKMVRELKRLLLEIEIFSYNEDLTVTTVEKKKFEDLTGEYSIVTQKTITQVITYFKEKENSIDELKEQVDSLANERTALIERIEVLENNTVTVPAHTHNYVDNDGLSNTNKVTGGVNP